MDRSRTLLVFFLFFSFSIRLWQLDKNPAGFFADEASIGVNAYSLLTTGKDEHGASWPLFFRAFGEYKSPVQTYSTIPFVAIFGLTEFAVRLPSAIYGTLTIIAIYLLATELFSHKFASSPEPRALNGLPLVAAVLLAISPWHIHLSRSSLEGLAAYVFFTTLALYLFLKSVRLNWSITFYLSLLAFNLALYSYFPARIFIPIFVSGLLFLSRREIPRLRLLHGVALLIILGLPLIVHLVSGYGLARFRQVSIFARKDLTPNQQIKYFAANYLAHFSPTFLLSKGDIDFPGQFITRHSVRGLGQLYSWQAPLIILAVISVLMKRRGFYKSSKSTQILILWLLLYPLGSAVTSAPGPQATRSIIGVIPFQILTAQGLVYLYRIINRLVLTKFLISSIKYLVSSILIIAVVLSFINYLTLYFVKYPLYSADFWGWQYGPRKIITYFRDHQQEYDKFYLQAAFNAPEIFLKFYAPQGECAKCYIGTPIEHFNPTKRQLFAVTPELLAETKIPLEKIHSIPYPNGQTAFVIVKRE